MEITIGNERHLKIWFMTLLIILTMLFAMPQDALSNGRVALVIGNGQYISSPLSNSLNDAELMLKTLNSSGFKVKMYKNLDQNKMKSVLRDFFKRLKDQKDSVGLFYYSGHGMHVKGENYMIPIDLTLKSEDDVSKYGVNIQDVLTKMKNAGNRMNFVVLDACHDNPFKKKFKSAKKGLDRMDAPRGTFIAYAAEPHNVALQGRGENSIFTETLSIQMLKPGIPVEMMFKNVRISVYKKTNGRQLPVTNNRLLDDFYFKQRKKLSLSKRNRQNRRNAMKSEKKRQVNNIVRDDYFIAYRNGVVRDTEKDLEWIACPDRNMTWEDTKSWVESLTIGGGKWRMPTREELRNLYQVGKGTHNMSPLLRPTGWWVWAEEKINTNLAWGFNFKNGQELFDSCDKSKNKRGFAVRLREREGPQYLELPRRRSTKPWSKRFDPYQ